MSDDVQRYNMINMQCKGSSFMRSERGGKWVAWRHYKRLRAEVERLQERAVLCHRMTSELAEAKRRIEQLELALAEASSRSRVGDQGGER